VPLALGHGVLAATALVLALLVAIAPGVAAIVKYGVAVLVLAALGGFFLLSFHLRGKPHPRVVVVLHALLAVGGVGWFFAFAGIISALPAIVAGALDAWACRNVAAAENTLWRHAGLMLSAWTLFALGCLLCSPSDPHQAHVIGGVMHGVGALTLIVGAHAGGRLAHVHHLPGACDGQQE